MRRIRLLSLFAASLALAGVAGAVSLAPGDILVSFPFDATLVKIDPVTGAQELITADLGILGHDVVVDGSGQIFVAGSRQVIRVDAASGAVTPVANNLTPGNVRDLVLDAGSLLVLTQSSLDAIDRVDPSTGAVSRVAETYVAGAGCGASPPLCNTSLESVDLEAMTVEADGDLLLSIGPRLTGTEAGVHRFDPTTGGVELVASEIDLARPQGIAISSTGEVALGHVNAPTPACGVPCNEILLVNPGTGGFDLLSADGALSFPFQLEYEADGSLLVLHLAFVGTEGFVAERLIRIDPQGNQQILAADLDGARGLTIVGLVPTPTPTPTVVPTVTPTTTPTKKKRVKVKKLKTKKIKKTKKAKKS